MPAQSTYFTVRGQSYFSRPPKYWPPIPLSARRVRTPRLWGGGRKDSPGGEGDGGSIVWKTREIGLSSYSKICTLWMPATERTSSNLQHIGIVTWSVCLTNQHLQHCHVICLFDQSTSAALSRDLFFWITICSICHVICCLTNPYLQHVDRERPRLIAISNVLVTLNSSGENNGRMTYTEAEFLDVIGEKVLRVYLLAIHCNLCN